MAANYALLLSIVVFYLSQAYGQGPLGYAVTYNDYVPELNNLSPISAAVPPAVGIYVQRFKQEVQNSSFLRNLFDIENFISPEVYYSGEFHTVTCVAAETGTPNPTSVAAIAAQYFNSSVDSITPALLVNVHAFTTGTYLYSKGVLNPGNAEQLANLYHQNLEAAGRQIVSSSCKRSHVSSLIITMGRFFGQLNAFAPQQLYDLSEAFAEAWRTQSRIFRGTSGGNKVAPNQCTGEDSFLRPDDRICSMKSRAIDIFYETLLRFVKSSDLLNEMFNPILNRHEEVNIAYFYDVLYYYYNLGGAHPGDLAAFTSRYVKTCTSPTFETLFAVRVLWIAKFFESENIMHESNAESLALSYGNTLVKKTQDIYNPDYPLSRIVVLMSTARDLLVNAGTVGQEYVKKIALYLGNEWRCQCDASSKG